MKNTKKIFLIVLVNLLGFGNPASLQAQVFPDGSPIPEWFSKTEPTNVSTLGKKYVVTNYGVKNDSNILQTTKIQSVIDKAHAEGGGVIIIPNGTFLSGSLFFKQGTHLYLEKGGTLKGSDDISDFPLITTRIEGQTLKYFAAFINADNLNGFTISGKGTLNGNGLRFWKAFWLRRKWNPNCTNMDEQRPRLLFVSNSKNVQISDIRLINSPFWTSHYYKCKNLKLLNLYIFAPTSGYKAPSSDAIDLDVCQNVLIKNCYMSVNDDAVCLKGGKGPLADKDPNNGTNCNIIIEDNTFEKCPAFTLGSESVHTRNVIFRRSKMIDALNVFLLKMRPDTPQKHEYILVEDIKGTVKNFHQISPWLQFFDLKGQAQPYSSASNITVRNINLKCDTAFKIKKSDQYTLSNFTFENINLSTSKNEETKLDFVENLVWKNVKITN